MLLLLSVTASLVLWNLRSPDLQIWDLQETSLPSGDIAKLPAASTLLELFVQSARANYANFELDGKKFLKVTEDPLNGIPGTIVIWVRKCYVDMKKILEREVAERLGKRFVLLGTAGIGKSVFTVFWIHYLAAMNKRVVWKFCSGECHILDFSQEAATVRGPVVDLKHPAVQQVVHDAKSWLIIDGGHEANVEYECSVLLACSDKKTNHKQICKHPLAQTRFFLWTEDEIKEACDAFTEHQVSEFSAMSLPDKETALANFKVLGGVPRYILNAGIMTEGELNLDRAFQTVDAGNCLDVYAGKLNNEWSDILVHTFVDENDGEYKKCRYDLASPHVCYLLEQKLKEVQNVQKV